MYVFVVWKTSISGWSKEILAVFDSEKKSPRVRSNTLGKVAV